MNTNDHDRAESERIYRYWVEIRDLREGSARNLPLHAMRLIHLGGKRGARQKPDEQMLRLDDGTAVIEAKDIDELAAQLRQKYPDNTYERRLHWERDLEAEQRRADALKSLIHLVADEVAEELLLEQVGEARKPRTD